MFTLIKVKNPMRSLLQLLRTEGERKTISRKKKRGGDAEQHSLLCKLITHPKQSKFRFILAQWRAEPRLFTEEDTDRYPHEIKQEGAKIPIRRLLHAVGHAVPGCWKPALCRHLHRGCGCRAAEQHQGRHEVPVAAHSCREAHGCVVKPDGVLVVVCFSLTSRKLRRRQSISRQNQTQLANKAAHARARCMA